MRKMTAMLFVTMMIMSALISFPTLSSNAVAVGPNQAHPEKQNVTLFMYGPGRWNDTTPDHNEFLNTTKAINETPTQYMHIDEMDESIINPSPREGMISRWYTEPIEKDIVINGTLYCQLFARGDILDIGFTIRFYKIDGGGETQIGNYMIDTDRNDLDRNHSKLFAGETTIPTNENILINKGENFGIEISYDGTSTDDIISGPTDSNRNVTVCYSSAVTESTSTERGPSLLKFQCNSIDVDVTTITKNVNKKYLEIKTEVYSAFGGPIESGNFSDITEYYINVTGPSNFQGKTFDNAKDEPENFEYDNTSKKTNVIFKWYYDDDNPPTGEYFLNISVMDRANNWWMGSKDMYADFNWEEPKVDFSIPRLTDNVTFKVDDNKVSTLYVDEYVEVWIYTNGSGDPNFYPAHIPVSISTTEIGNPDNIESTYSTYIDISLGITQTYFIWQPDEAGDFNVKVTLDPENEYPEEYDGESKDDENNTGWYWKGGGKGDITITNRKSPIAEIDSPIATEIYQKDDFPLRFDGTSSISGNDDDIENYEWELDGASIGTSASFDHDFEIEKHKYNVKLIVTNTDGKEDSKLILITVNTKPDAIINKPSDASQFDIDEEISFGSNSDDNEGDSLSYKWSSNKDGPLSEEEDFTSNLTEGEHEITLEVSDGFGGTDTTSITITVGDIGNNAPEANIDSPSNGDDFFEGLAITFDGSSSTDQDTADIDSLTYSWVSDIDGEFGTEKKFTYSALILGDHEITLTVEDQNGGTDEISVSISIIEEDKTPVSDIKSNGQNSVEVELDDDGKVVVTFSADGTTYKENVNKYSWDFGDGETTDTTVPTVTHEYTEEGTFTVTLITTNNEGGTSQNTMTVKVDLKDKPSSSNNDDDWKMYVAIIAVVGVIVLIVVAIMMSGKGKEDWEDGEDWEDEEEEW